MPTTPTSNSQSVSTPETRGSGTTAQLVAPSTARVKSGQPPKAKKTSPSTGIGVINHSQDVSPLAPHPEAQAGDKKTSSSALKSIKRPPKTCLPRISTNFPLASTNSIARRTRKAAALAQLTIIMVKSQHKLPLSFPTLNNDLQHPPFDFDDTFSTRLCLGCPLC